MPGNILHLRGNLLRFIEILKILQSRGGLEKFLISCQTAHERKWNPRACSRPRSITDPSLSRPPGPFSLSRNTGSRPTSCCSSSGDALTFSRRRTPCCSDRIPRFSRIVPDRFPAPGEKWYNRALYGRHCTSFPTGNFKPANNRSPTEFLPEGIRIISS